MEDIYLLGVEITNFQSHHNSKLSFTKGINALVGTSDAGKSGVARAIIWNALNEPSGNEFITKGKSEACVITHWSNGYSIERRRNRGGSKNVYITRKDGEIINEYTGFGTSVPPEIIEIHGIKPLSNGVYFNYANQLESAFMISNSPKVRAEIIGNLEELGRIDEELININDDIKTDKRTQKELNQEIAEYNTTIQELENRIDVGKRKIETLKILRDKVREQEQVSKMISVRNDRLHILVDEVNRVSEVVNKATKITGAWDDSLQEHIQTQQKLTKYAERLSVIQEELNSISFLNEEALKQLETLSGSVDQSINLFQMLNKYAQRLNEIEEVVRTSKANIASDRVTSLDFSSLDKEIEQFRFVFEKLKRLNDIDTNIESNKRVIESTQLEIEKLLNHFVDALHDAEVCPTCTQSTKDITTNQITQVI